MVLVRLYQEREDRGARKMLGAGRGIAGGESFICGAGSSLRPVPSTGLVFHAGPWQSSGEEASKRLHAGKTALATLKPGKQMWGGLYAPARTAGEGSG